MEDFSFLKKDYILLSGSNSVSVQWLREWWNQFSYTERDQLEAGLRHSVKIMSFEVPQGFVEGILKFWDFNRRVFQFAKREMLSTLEEIQLITGLELRGDCVQVTTGAMKESFRTHFKMKHQFLETRWKGTTEISMKIMYNLFGSRRNYTEMERYFTMDLDESTWKRLSMDAFAMCVLAKVYFPCPNEKLDVAMGFFTGSRWIDFSQEVMSFCICGRPLIWWSALYTTRGEKKRFVWTSIGGGPPRSRIRRSGKHSLGIWKMKKSQWTWDGKDHNLWFAAPITRSFRYADCGLSESIILPSSWTSSDVTK